MKRSELIIAFAILVICGACSAGKDATGNSDIRKAANSRPAPIADSTPASNSETNVSTPGERIDKPADISFEPSGFPADWQWIDPEKGAAAVRYDLTSGRLKMTVPSGRDYFGETRNAPMLIKSVTGDFEIETKVSFSPKESYQGAGLVVIRNDSNYLRLERAFGGTGGGESGIRFDLRSDEAYEPLATPDQFSTEAQTVELRLVRKGAEFTGFWREPGGQWREVATTKTSYPATLRVGLIACNTADPIEAEFSYIRLGPLK